MDSLLLLLFSFLVIVIPSKLAAADCPVTRCSRHDGPVIKFPFRLKDHPPHCGHREFEVSCFKNMTMIRLSSSSGLFPVRTIDYQVHYFSVYDGNGCLPRRLLNFTFSSRYYRRCKNYRRWSAYPQFPYTSQDPCCYYIQSDYSNPPKLTLLNCSTAQNLSTGSFNEAYLPISCLSAPGHQVLAVPPSTSVTELPVPTCATLKAELYLPLRGEIVNNDYRCVVDNVLGLEWDIYNFPACQKCTTGTYCEVNSTSNQLECYPSYSTFPDSSQQPQQPKGHASTIVGVTIACLVFILAMAGAIFFYVKQSNSIEDKESQIKVERFLNDHKSHVPTRYSYADIKKMTNGFKKKLGEGGFGSVFSGKLPNGVPVAVKVLNDSKGNGDDFVNEVGTIGRIHHVNVVRLLGFSAEGGKRAVIYELMPNRSLEKFISPKEQSNNAPFDWEKLHNIIDGIAKGIEYLHQGCDQRILHFDIKPHNILLDHDFNPKISDFGLAKLCSKEDSIISMTAARGTVGYIAPEFFNGSYGSVSHKSDVYSFGMLVLESVGARKESSDLQSSSNEVYFPELIYNHLIQGEALELKLDSDEDAKISKKLVIVALWCIQWYPVNRPSMKAVVRMLEGASENLIMPPNPFASTSTQITLSS